MTAPSLRKDSTPDKKGHFGPFGGRYVAETLMPLIKRVEQAYQEAREDEKFTAELDYYLKHYVGRPSPLYHAPNLSSELNGAKVYLKRDELNHTGSHKINNCLGQILLAKRMGCSRIIAETGAGQHGVATATCCALFNLPCVVYMGAKDIERQQPNVFRMKLLGAEVRTVDEGSNSLKDAMNEALRDWTTNVANTFYVIGSTAGPHPYPTMVRDFQSIIGQELRQQLQECEGCLPDLIMACVGGGSNAMGIFYDFLPDEQVRLIAVEAAGKGLDSGKTAAAIAKGSIGVLHGSKSYYLQDRWGQIQEADCISAGLDYPGIGPEHSHLHQSGRVEYMTVGDEEALDAFKLCSRLEGIIPALEPSHAIAKAREIIPQMSKDQIAVINLCGRGDKDVGVVMQLSPEYHTLTQGD